VVRDLAVVAEKLESDHQAEVVVHYQAEMVLDRQTERLGVDHQAERLEAVHQTGVVIRRSGHTNSSK